MSLVHVQLQHIWGPFYVRASTGHTWQSLLCRESNLLETVEGEGFVRQHHRKSLQTVYVIPDARWFPEPLGQWGR